MVSERQGEIRKEYGYDKRGNLTSILENGTWKKQYVYGAINRLEEAVDAAGKQARYQYNGLGHRVGKQEGVLPKEKLEKLDPQSRIGMEIGNSRQITYTLDLTRQYYNLLERTEENRSQRYFWDGNVAVYEENGERNYYLQDELGSPLRIEDSAGNLRESYGYGAFGEDLYQNQGEIQPFGYTGYQRDEIAGTYYAQAREYLAENGRFAGQDLIVGFMDLPFSMNRYSYCFNAPMVLVDLDGEWPSLSDIGKGIQNGIKDVGNAINKGVQKVWETGQKAVKTAVDWVDEHKTELVAVGIMTGAVVAIASGGVIAATVGAGVLIGGGIGGISNIVSGSGNFTNGFIGGSVNGFITVFGTTSLAINPFAANAAGGAMGSVLTDILNNKDLPLKEQKSTIEILISAIASSGTQAVIGGGLAKIWDKATLGRTIGNSKGWDKMATIFWETLFSGGFSFSTGTIASILSGALGKKIVDGNFMKNITELLEGCLE